VTLVGHDAGGMVAFACAKRFAGLRGVVIMNTVVPGIQPWERVLANPYIWHFAFHSIPGLPEELVHDHVRTYFDYFYDAISVNPDAIPDTARERYTAGYAERSALTQGFELYRAFRTDAKDNTRTTDAIATPVLYLRGDGEGGDIGEYADGFRRAGVQNLSTRIIAGAGHFAPEESPLDVWTAISAQVTASATTNDIDSETNWA
jgi:pimeloyl-ACP methyl ester carboxylesterase